MAHLDALRGIAALVVLISHCANAGLLPSNLGLAFGRMGVGLFYVLSAFLLTVLYIEKPPNKSSLHKYMVRRVARVFPLFYAALIISFILEVLTEISIFGAFDSWAVSFRNIFLIHGTSVLWSIPVEVQFYTLFVGFWILTHVNIKYAFLFLVLFQVIIGISALLIEMDKNSLPYWMHFFTLGCVLAVIFKNDLIISQLLESPAIKVCLLILIILTSVLSPIYRGGYFDITILPIMLDPISLLWILLVCVVFIFRAVPAYWVDNKLFRMLGELSFGVYLVHIAVIKAVIVVPIENYVHEYIGFLIVLLTTYAIAAVVNYYFVRPVQKYLTSALRA